MCVCICTVLTLIARRSYASKKCALVGNREKGFLASHTRKCAVYPSKVFCLECWKQTHTQILEWILCHYKLIPGFWNYWGWGGRCEGVIIRPVSFTCAHFGCTCLIYTLPRRFYCERRWRDKILNCDVKIYSQICKEYIQFFNLKKKNL